MARDRVHGTAALVQRPRPASPSRITVRREKQARAAEIIAYRQQRICQEDYNPEANFHISASRTCLTGTRVIPLS
jgi:hypothetical protein